MKHRKIENLFDVKPLNENGVVDVYLEPVINLRKKPIYRTDDFHELMDQDFDFRAELLSFGGQVIEEPSSSRPRPKPIPSGKSEVEKTFDRIISEINKTELKGLDSQFIKPLPDDSSNVAAELPTSDKHIFPGKDKVFSKKILIVLAILICGFGVWKLGVKVKSNIIKNGGSAVLNLEEAKASLGDFKLDKALLNFTNAYEEFSKAGDNLNFMGGYLGGLLAEIPGNSQYKSARNLVEAGKLFSKAGQSLASAMNSVSKTGMLLNPNNSDLSLVANLKNAIVLSRANLHKASDLLTDIDPSVIPEDKKQSFLEFQEKLPEIIKLADEGLGYSRFLESFIATNSSKKYLILFQNPSELRPTGGFPGSYGILTFKNGKIDEFKVDDVYNIDGQLKENIIPPKELQHITPNWGMRDANWFIDFPTSAKKVMEFFKKESGSSVDGVITFSPVIVRQILEITGPVELPKYNLVLDSDNFIQEIQAEVEYGENRTQPKSILVDFAPKLLEKIYLADSSKWLKIFNVLISSPERKDILMYFKDFGLQSFVLEKGFSGEVKNVPEGQDYIMTTLSNVKGSKTDAVINNNINLYVSSDSDTIRHKLVITRKHNGGLDKYGFYNRQSPTYIRVLVPDDAKFVSISGNDKTNFKPLINYESAGFSRDDDLYMFERGYDKDNKTGVTTYKESGKTGFGFWLVVNPRETKTVELNYEVPRSNPDKPYELYIQKQPGLQLDNLELLLKNATNIVTSQKDAATISTSGDMQVVDYNLDKDLSIKAILK